MRRRRRAWPRPRFRADGAGSPVRPSRAGLLRAGLLRAGLLRGRFGSASSVRFFCGFPQKMLAYFRVFPHTFTHHA
ncbi:hypothetical protein BN940_11171 [Castellaniella defragrans 65Phen]|uniref:Uncharacterized protein n=1 Tax=Castellaniella defragrans (strain DSM 12143 / CCUG 39792 / 65Phen) TaxID=1437824 RepID=W8WYP8_CASD6|nr:hypothetical protein BN940_11171 [Castellaniella defragrans 65Phen]